jgi:hypothetical protein
MLIPSCLSAWGRAEVRRPSNHLEAAAVFPADPVGPMKINNLLDKAAMPHNKALQTDSQTAAQFVCR